MTNMTANRDVELLKLLWQTELSLLNSEGFCTTDLRSIAINCPGDYDEMLGCYNSAEIVIDGVSHRGGVVFSATDMRPMLIDNSFVLQVVPYPSTLLCRENGEVLPQIIVNIPEKVRQLYLKLLAGAADASCGSYIKEYSSVVRINMFSRLQTDRLNRKRNDIMKLYAECRQDWTQTIYLMLFRTMGGSNNRESFTELARRVPYSVISREKSSITVVESLLLGTSGLLESYGEDQYVNTLKEDFEYLSNKYNLSPMDISVWDMQRNKPFNHPVLRIVQLVNLLTHKDFLFDCVMNCRTAEDVLTLLSAEASEYWQTHFVPAQTSARKPKTLGRDKRWILGINFVAPMQFAYGHHSMSDDLITNSTDILELLTAEQNYITDRWHRNGAIMESAFDSQAIIQLYNEYCMRGKCTDCPVGKNVIKECLRGCK